MGVFFFFFLGTSRVNMITIISYVLGGCEERKSKKKVAGAYPKAQSAHEQGYKAQNSSFCVQLKLSKGLWVTVTLLALNLKMILGQVTYKKNTEI